MPHSSERPVQSVWGVLLSHRNPAGFAPPSLWVIAELFAKIPILDLAQAKGKDHSPGSQETERKAVAWDSLKQFW
jgi:hypothetical protein